MSTLTKQFNDGGVLTVSYKGNGDDSAIFVADINEGLDREVNVTFISKSKKSKVVKKVVQEGRRELFYTASGPLLTADGQTFNVLKDGK